MKARVIFHIDVNNAFLSWTAVKLLKEGYKIDIRTIPSIIGGDEEKRHGIVLAKSPVAKKYGIVTAETIYSARKKCPEVKIYKSDYAFYKEMSNSMFDYLSKYSPTIEKFSIDECFIDMSGTSLLYNDLESLAYKIKDEIKSIFGFTVNIGIANNKLCAKMASDFEKPDKVHTLYEKEIDKKMWPLDVSDLFMVGKKSSTKLKSLGINTIGDLAKCDVKFLTSHFNKQGIMMWEYANGIDNSPVEKRSATNKGISVSETLSTDIGDKNKIKKILLRQTENVSRRIRMQNLYTTTVAITIKTPNFVNISKQLKLDNPTNSTEEIYKYVLKLLDLLWDDNKIRSIGLRLSNLSPTNIKQISLFNNTTEKIDKIQKTVDLINDKFGNTSIIPASLLDEKK